MKKVPFWLVGIKVSFLIYVFSLFELGTEPTSFLNLPEWFVGCLVGTVFFVIFAAFGVAAARSRVLAKRKSDAKDTSTLSSPA